ncbi:MAG: AAA family ATPase [Solirubrobacteraceae bacterium]
MSVEPTDLQAPPARRLDVPALLAAEDEPIPYRVVPVAANGYVTLLAGHGGEGKSLLASGLAIGVATGSLVAGLRCVKGRVLIIDGENGEKLIGRRYRLAQGPPEGVEIYEATGLDLAHHGDWLKETILAEKANFIVIDSLRTLAPSMQENDGDTVLPVASTLRAVARETGAAILVLHHRPKHGPGYRGSSVLRDQVDALFVLGRDPSDPDRRTRRFLHCDPSRDGKMRFDLEPAEHWLSIDVSDGLLSLTQAEPFGEQTHEPTSAERRAEQIVGALEGGALNRSDVARSIGCDPADGTIGRALRQLRDEGVIDRQANTYSLVLPHGKDPGNPANGPLATLPAALKAGNGKARPASSLPSAGEA